VTTYLKEGLIFPGQQLETANRQYRLRLQGDGNLVVYKTGKGAIWSSATHGKSVSFLALQNDGNLVLYADDGKTLWTTKTNGKSKATLIMQGDGNLVLYRKGRAIWSSGI
jgi:hypothetical protein